LKKFLEGQEKHFLQFTSHEPYLAAIDVILVQILPRQTPKYKLTEAQSTIIFYMIKAGLLPVFHRIYNLIASRSGVTYCLAAIFFHVVLKSVKE